jgi:hypothetical protein
MATFAVFIDGVLRSQTNAPIYQGMALYKMLNFDNKVYILSKDKKNDERWLREQKLNVVDDIIGPEVPAPKDDLEFYQIQHIRGLGGGFEMAITADPELAAKLLKVGVTTLLFMQPIYMNEKFRPDGRQGVRSWQKIKEELESQQEAFLEDPRVQ